METDKIKQAIQTWARMNFFSKLETDARYYTKAAIDTLLAAYTNTATLTSTLLGYALLAGRAGGQTLKGGTAAGENLTLQSTNHATRGRIVVEDAIGTAWAALTFGSGWDNHGSGYQAGQYKRAGDLVFLRGLVVRTSGVGITIATLPSGYRPPDGCLFGTLTNTGIGRIDIGADGNIYHVSGGTDWVQLDGISFSTAA